MKKGVLPLPPELLPATRASADSDWFAQLWVFTFLYTAQQQKNRPPGGLLPEPGLYVRKALEAGEFSRKSSRLNRLRPDRPMIQTYPGSSFLP
jgi:hypothetical protein